VFCAPNSAGDTAIRPGGPPRRTLRQSPFGPDYFDTQGTLTAEKAWVRSYIDESYLWYADVPDAHPANYSTPQAYFSALKTTQLEHPAAALDRFHFYYTTPHWEAMSQGHRLRVRLAARGAVDNATPGVLHRVQRARSPAGHANVVRGAKILKVDGADLVSGGDSPHAEQGTLPRRAGRCIRSASSTWALRSRATSC
jgi:hypothetical protein